MLSLIFWYQPSLTCFRMLVKFWYLVIINFSVFQSVSMAQVVIWQENFNSYPDGTTIGGNYNKLNENLDWLAGGCTACADTADWWEIRSGAMEARDVNELVYIQTEEVDISGYINVSFSVDIIESGDHEGLYFGLDACGDQEKEDYVNVLYRLDNGSWNMVANFLGWCGLYGSCNSHTLFGDDGINSGDCRDHDDDWGSVTVNKNNLIGNTLELRLEAINSATDELIRMDNLKVEGTIVLPVTLTSFSVTAYGKSALLRWQTVSETNNDYFQVERSSSGNSGWEPIGVVAGAGKSSETLTYSYMDPTPHSEKSFYRLKQVDYDGTYSYSSIQSVIIPRTIAPYPNPAANYLIVPVNARLQPPDIKLFNVTAKEFCVSMESQKSYIKLDIRDLPSGNYILNINNETHHILVLK